MCAQSLHAALCLFNQYQDGSNRKKWETTAKIGPLLSIPTGGMRADRLAAARTALLPAATNWNGRSICIEWKPVRLMTIYDCSRGPPLLDILFTMINFCFVRRRTVSR